MPLTLARNELDALFPANIWLNAQGEIAHLGPSLLRHLPDQAVGKSFKRYFRIQRETSSTSCSAGFQQIILRGIAGATGIVLRGAAKKRNGHLILLVSHVPRSELESSRQLTFDDFSPTDSSVDLLLAIKLQSVLRNETQSMSTELVMKKEQAEAANVAKSQFLATMSHELRTPLNGILGMAQVLANDTLTSRQEEMVGIMLKSGDALVSILNDILDFSKIEAGRIDLDPQPTDLRETVKRSLQLYQATADQKGIGLVLTGTETVPMPLMIDGLRIGQCLSNLVSNAVKFTSQGHVHVHIDCQESEADDRLTVRISIKDTGIGIAPEKCDQLFDPFTQADSSTTREYGGSGLGLSISRKLARMMGGDIVVESQVGHGSTFTISFEAELISTPQAIETAA